MNLNRLTFEACESLQDILVSKFSNVDKEEIYQLIKDWINRYNIKIDTVYSADQIRREME